MEIQPSWLLNEDPDSPERQEIARQEQALECPTVATKGIEPLVTEQDRRHFLNFACIELAAGYLDWRHGLNACIEALLQTIFAPDQSTLALSHETVEDFVREDRPFKIGENFLNFLAERGFFEDEQSEGRRLDAAALADHYKAGNEETRKRMLSNAFFGDDSFWDWLKANDTNRFVLWQAVAPEAIAPGESFPHCEKGKNKCKISASRKRKNLKQICGKAIANDIGNWDGARYNERYGKFLNETVDWLQCTDNVKKLLPPGNQRDGERVVARHLSEEFDIPRMSHKTLKKYGFIKSKKQR